MPADIRHIYQFAIAVVTFYPLRCRIPMDTPEFSLKINGFTPESLPMERMADYLAAFAKLLGSTSGVHFVRVAAGSAELVSQATDRDEPKVTRRLEAVRYGAGTVEARNAFQKIDDLLVEDATDAVLLRGKSNLLFFPGNARPVQTVFGPVAQEDSIDGVLIGLGGRDETVPIHLSDGKNTYKCTASKEIAKRMAPFIFGPMLRVFGAANWIREADGKWRLSSMTISRFDDLKDDSSDEVIKRLRAIPGNTWHELEDPYAVLAELRNGDR